MTDATHAAHCCEKHGCKYINDWDTDKWCPVVEGVVEADGSCEVCWYEREVYSQDLMSVEEAVEILVQHAKDDPLITDEETDEIVQELKSIMEKIHDQIGP